MRKSEEEGGRVRKREEEVAEADLDTGDGVLDGAEKMARDD